MLALVMKRKGKKGACTSSERGSGRLLNQLLRGRGRKLAPVMKRKGKKVGTSYEEEGEEG